MEKHATVDAYIASFPEDIQATLTKIRRTIHTAVPEAKEVISYQMPAYRMRRVFAYFAVFKDHYSLFIPSASTRERFKEELAPYPTAKATIQFPKSGPIPYDLIARLVKQAADDDSAM